MNLRDLCLGCFKSPKTCHCAQVRQVRTRVRFVILQHPKERRKTIGTGRMTHQSLPGSRLIAGVCFDEVPEVVQLIADPSNHCVMLYPGPRACNLSDLSREELETAYPSDRQLVIFVIDGTWGHAKKMVNQSRCLSRLPRVSFSSQSESEYQIRQQPRSYCLSTIEAVHRLIGILEPTVDADPLLELFRLMVKQQVRFAELKVGSYRHG